MADDAHFYRVRADAERANAEAATLDNVRERADRAARSWEAMADRAERTRVMRETREAATIAAREHASDEAVSG
jgi:hypothetical protein